MLQKFKSLEIYLENISIKKQLGKGRINHSFPKHMNFQGALIPINIIHLKEYF